MVTAFLRFGALARLQTGYKRQSPVPAGAKKPAEAGFFAGCAANHLGAEASAAGAEASAAGAEASAAGAEASTAGAVAAGAAAGAAFLLLAMPKPTARPTASTITATKTVQTTG